MKRVSTLLSTLLALCLSLSGFSQSETHNFITYDTTFTNSSSDIWNAIITRPSGLFGNGPDTASRPLIIMMPGVGQMGSSDFSLLTQYGPHYWLANGWDGSVQLGNGTHYPIIISVTHVSNDYPSPWQYYIVLSYILQHYHIKPGCAYGTGLSEGSFTSSGMIEYEETLGDHAGMKLFNALACFEGTPTTPYTSSPPSVTSYPNSQWADTAYFRTWATQYHGKYFYLEGSGSDNFRDGWHYADAMNDVSPKSAYFSYEDDGGGAHCCWNDMYSPYVTNWSCVGTLGTYNSPSQAGTNTMGDYTGGNVYQWMLRQGDTSLVGSTTTKPTPTANAGTNQTITLPTSSVTLAGSGTESGGSIASYGWSEVSGPSTASFSSTTVAGPVVSKLVAGTYVFQLTVTDANGTTATSTVTIVVNAALVPVANAGGDPTITLPVSSITLSGSGSESGGSIASYNWSEVSGPSTATFSSTTITNPVVSNLVVGTYIFQLTVTDAVGTKASSTVAVIVDPAISTSSTATYYALPGTVEAQNYASISNCQTEPTTDPGGGADDVGYINQGSWISYNVNVATAGSYTLNFRLAADNSGAAFQVQNSAGQVLTTVTMKNSNGWQSWMDITATVELPAGQQTIKLVSISQANWNIHWFSAVTNNYSGGFAIPGLIQAEDWVSSGGGVQNEATGDVGGGEDVGYINKGSWMDYPVNVSAAGVYTMSFRVSAVYSGATFVIQDGYGNIYATVSVPVTGAYQTYTTVTASVTLCSGPQDLRLTSTSVTNWNINWFSAALYFGVGTSTSAVTNTAMGAEFSQDTTSTISNTTTASGVLIYPNPVTDAFNLAINNGITGKLNVQVLSAAGAVLRTYEFQKEDAAIQWQLSLSGLPAGVYVLHIQNQTWQYTRKLVKL